MITIIAGTNRKGSNTKKVALEYKRLLLDANVTSQILALDEQAVFERNEAFEKMETDFLKTADKFIFVVPEYNGSFPGVLKLMIDNSDVSAIWASKKALLTGVSTGRAGNLRGLEHLTGSLLHLKMFVHPNRLPLSVVHTLLDGDAKFIDEGTIKTIKNQIAEFLSF